MRRAQSGSGGCLRLAEFVYPAYTRKGEREELAVFGDPKTGNIAHQTGLLLFGLESADVFN